MHPHQLNDEESLFNEAIGIANEDKRAAFLDGACRGRRDLRARLDALLEEHFHSIAFQATLKTPSTDVEAEGAVIGPYKLLQQIGEGGFGVVYMAEQEKPMRRRVALKIIKLGMDTKQVIARFEAERQALAMMEHPNIAKVLDAGSTDNGRPYFVMELVRGVAITEFCDENKLSLEERLALFIDVCHAVQHAHQKGVIHRDLKPGNILITLHDDKAVPKVIDFGIAKATQQNLTDKTLFTRFEQFIGTPVYMSPEQVQMSGLDVDTRSDVYSLGVLLYEMVAGVPPFDAKTLLQSGEDEIRRRIREEEPQRPSNRVSAMTQEERTTLAQRRKSDPSKLRSRIQGELDLVVMKAMEKDRTRRYETANGLAADVRRFLLDEPVAAAAPSAAYLLKKTMVRYRRPLIVGAVMAAMLVTGTTVSILQMLRARKAERDHGTLREQAVAASRQALLAQQEAEAKAKEARQIAYASDMNVLQRELDRGNLGRAREILNRNRPQANGDEDLRGWEWRHLWLQCQGAPHRQLFAGEKKIRSLSVSDDGKLTAVTSHGKVWLLDTVTGKEIASWQGAHALFSPASPWLVYWSRGSNPQDGQLGAGQPGYRLWNVVTKTVERFLPVNGRFHSGVAFSGDGSVFAVATRPYNGRMSRRWLLWDIPSGEQLKSIPADSVGPGASYPFDLSPDGQLAAHGVLTGGLGIIRIVDVQSEKERWKAEPHRLGEWVERLKFSPDGSLLAVAIGTNTKEVQLWDVGSGTQIADLEGHSDYVKDLLFTPDGNRLISASADQSIRIWDVFDPDNLPSTSTVLRGHTDEVARLAWHPNGTTLLTGGNDGQVLAWDMDDESASQAHVSSKDATTVGWPLRGNHPTEATFFPDEWGTGRIWIKAVSPNGEFVAASGYRLDLEAIGQNQIDVWHVSTQSRVGVFGRFLKACHAVTFSPDSRRLVGGGGGSESVKIWDLESRQELLTLETDHGPFNAIQFSDDGTKLGARSERGIYHVWRAPSWEEIQQVEAGY